MDTDIDFEFKPAEPEDAESIAGIVARTSGGIVDYLLRGAVPNISPQEILTSLIISEDNAYSYENAVLAVKNNELAGLVLSYPWHMHNLPDTAKNLISRDRLERLWEILFQLDEKSLHINTIWVREDLRGRGIADAFIDIASSLALESGLNRLSLHVWADNTRAINFYNRHNFLIVKRIPVEPHTLLPHQGGKLLMAKDL